MISGMSVFRTRLGDAPVNELRLGRGRSRQLIHPSFAGTDTIDLHLNELDPDSGRGPRHYHRDAENIYWVLDGSIEVGLPDETVVLTRDELLLIPAGVIHETSNPGPDVARFIEIYVPAGDDFHIVQENDDV